MKRLLWLGLLFTSISWLFFIPIFTTPDWKMGIFFLIIGILCNILALWKNKPLQIHKKYLILLILLILSILIINYPYNIGMIVLTIGVLLHGIKNQLLRCKKANALIAGISLTGIVLIIQTVLFPFYTIFISDNFVIFILH